MISVMYVLRTTMSSLRRDASLVAVTNPDRMTIRRSAIRKLAYVCASKMLKERDVESEYCIDFSIIIVVNNHYYRYYML